MPPVEVVRRKIADREVAKPNTAVRASAGVLNLLRASSSHSSVAKKLSHMALLYARRPQKRGWRRRQAPPGLAGIGVQAGSFRARMKFDAMRHKAGGQR
jgi:hypothetical protein